MSRVMYRQAYTRGRIPVTDNVTIDIFDVATGVRIGGERGHNLVVKTGADLVRDRLNPYSSAKPITLFGLGTGGGPARSNQTELESEIVPKLPVARFLVGEQDQLSIQLHLTSTQFNGVTIREAGLFTEDEMVARYVLASPIAKTATRAITLTWDLFVVSA